MYVFCLFNFLWEQNRVLCLISVPVASPTKAAWTDGPAAEEFARMPLGEENISWALSLRGGADNDALVRLKV